MMTTRVHMLKGHSPYHVDQRGQMLYVIRIGDGAYTGEERYLPNGWQGLDADVRGWLEGLGFTITSG